MSISFWKRLLQVRTYGLLFVAILFSVAAQGQVFDMVVAKDGSGDYLTIQSAIEEVAFDNPEPTLIFVKNGVYNEKIWLYASRKKVSLIGESMENVIISWDDYSGKTASMSTADSYTFLAEGDDLYAENITIRNTAGDVGQAVAIRTTGDRQVFKNCRFMGFQDTFYAHKNRQYLVDCHIEGATDFIFGDATTVFDSCTIHCLEGGQYITAPADTKLTSTTASDEIFYHGLLFRGCNVTAGPNVGDNSYYLGRPWQPGASSVFINCTLGNHIKPEGWSEWNDDNHLLGQFAEYENKDISGELIDISQRVPWSSQLSSEEVETYYSLDYFLKKEEVAWDPLAFVASLPAPQGLVASANVLSWETVEAATGYVISRNDSVIGFSEMPLYNDSTAKTGINTYRVKSVNSNGSLSAPSAELAVQTIIMNVKRPTELAFDVTIVNKELIISEKVNVAVYTLSGTLIRKGIYTDHISLEGLKYGLYLLKLENKKGNIVLKRIII